MIRTIARKELVEMLRDGRFRVMAAFVLMLAAASFAAGWNHYVDVQRQHVAAQQATRAQWLNQPPKNPHSAAHYGMYVFKPKSRLSLIDTGVDPRLHGRRVHGIDFLIKPSRWPAPRRTGMFAWAPIAPIA